MHEVINRADEQGWPMVVLLGDPAYCGRFGFERSAIYGITYEPPGAGSPDFMVRRLQHFDPLLRGVLRYCGRSSTGRRTEPARCAVASSPG